MKFTLEIELGNEAMQNGDDLSIALRHVAEDVPNQIREPWIGKERSFRDEFGNRVGKWQVIA